MQPVNKSWLGVLNVVFVAAFAGCDPVSKAEETDLDRARNIVESAGGRIRLIHEAEYSVAWHWVKPPMAADTTSACSVTLSETPSLADFQKIVGLESVRFVTLLRTRVTKDMMKAMSEADHLLGVNFAGCEWEDEAVALLPTLTSPVAIKIAGTPAKLDVKTIRSKVRVLEVFSCAVDLTDVNTCVFANTIEALELNHCRIVGAKALLSLKRLRFLELSGSDVSEQLVLDLRRLKNLEYVRMFGCRLEATTVEALRKALPHCRIDWSPPEMTGEDTDPE